MSKYYVYFNLHKACWSIMQRGRVVAHASELVLRGCEYRVRQAGQAKVRATKAKAVHAFVVADEILYATGLRRTERGSDLSVPNDLAIETIYLGDAYYNPYVVDSFVEADDHSRALSTDEVCLMSNQRKVHRMEVAA